MEVMRKYMRRFLPQTGLGPSLGSTRLARSESGGHSPSRHRVYRACASTQFRPYLAQDGMRHRVTSSARSRVYVRSRAVSGQMTDCLSY